MANLSTSAGLNFFHFLDCRTHGNPDKFIGANQLNKMMSQNINCPNFGCCICIRFSERKLLSVCLVCFCAVMSFMHVLCLADVSLSNEGHVAIKTWQFSALLTK